MVEDLPDICGEEQKIMQSLKKRERISVQCEVDVTKIDACFGIALHMHQPIIPAGGDRLSEAKLISNLQYMLEHPQIGDNHNAPIFINCYSRMGEIIPELVAEGCRPRVMLDYSGTLLWGLSQMGQERVLENLRRITTDKRYSPYVEWLGTMWAHAVVPSTPVPDIKLHMMAWRHHFTSLFGEEAMQRVRGFSPPEMQLPIHPDVCFAYVKALKECGYEWLLVQEHSIENIDGSRISYPHIPHRLIARNSLGEEEEIIVFIKTQGSDTKLVAQMQPYYEARSLTKYNLGGKNIPPFVVQIGDGENGGVMMNEFPSAYKKVFREIKGDTKIVGMNCSEYLYLLGKMGVQQKLLPPVQPVLQHRIWERVRGKYGAGIVNKVIDQLQRESGEFDLERGSWTSDKSWVKGYEDVLDSINKLSIAFHKKFNGRKVNTGSPKFREALLYLLLSQTSCFRYWGRGIWTDYAKEICRRGRKSLLQFR